MLFIIVDAILLVIEISDIIWSAYFYEINLMTEFFFECGAGYLMTATKYWRGR